MGGGCDNLAGSGTLPTTGSCGFNETILGGFRNQASGPYGVVSGGEYNLAQDQVSFVGGGCDNYAYTGGVTAPSGSCGGGGESLLGGSMIALTGLDAVSP